MQVEKIVSAVRRGDKRAAAQLMSMVENENAQGEECLRRLRRVASRSHVIGVTGWPGVGKSTLVSRIAGHFLNDNKGVGIIAIDPTSPLSGGSLLGDRERMRGIDGHERLFIRSMATRGYSGGIGAATEAFVRIMDAMGKDVVIVETVGVGQDQVSVSHLSDTLLMTVIPGMGDYLQALKAGIMEFGDIFVVNKADRNGVEEVVLDIKMILAITERKNEWIPPIVKTVAVKGDGIAELMIEIERHRNYITERGLISRKRIPAAKLEILEALKVELLDLVQKRAGLEERLDLYARQLLDGEIDRETLIETILKRAGIVK
jgi:LAO/AO transport system kinase